jgi:hypothetical protein
MLYLEKTDKNSIYNDLIRLIDASLAVTNCELLK